jgi:hypothetical protein
LKQGNHGKPLKKKTSQIRFGIDYRSPDTVCLPTISNPKNDTATGGHKKSPKKMPIKYPENAVTFPTCRFKALQKPKLRPGGADMSDECAWVFDGLGAGPGVPSWTNTQSGIQSG